MKDTGIVVAVRTVADYILVDCWVLVVDPGVGSHQHLKQRTESM